MLYKFQLQPLHPLYTGEGKQTQVLGFFFMWMDYHEK